MAEDSQFTVMQLNELIWPESHSLPSGFMLLVAADTDDLGAEQISAFVEKALQAGLVYLCAWGRGCERFHDVADELMVEKELRIGDVPTEVDIPHLLTTWHNSSLGEAVEFLAKWARPDSADVKGTHRVVLCLKNPDWTAEATRLLRSAEFPF